MFETEEQACDEWVKVASVTHPILKNADQYNDYYQAYHDLYPALEERFVVQAALVEKYH